MLVLHKPDVVSPITHRAYGAAGMKNTASIGALGGSEKPGGGALSNVEDIICPAWLR